ncbi:MAG: tetratricopeptide repeat protein [Chitinispirillaceae bacterium]|nr:tetratricopeptide repeat protein [Chitinispirillaceae bacterium]
MATFENRETWFDEELRRHCPEGDIDFAAVEARLLQRIRECEDLGALSILRLDEMHPAEKAEQVERDLFSQITQYSEYDEPVDECLKSEIDLSEKEWERLSVKLYDRMQPVVKLSPWEQQFMAFCEEPTTGRWEAMETLLFDRIGRCDERLQESWVRYETSEEPVTVSALETAEELLDEQIVKAASKPRWEQIIRAEQIVPYSRWEKMEERLFSMVTQQEELTIGQQPFWHILKHYRSLVRGIGVAGVVVGVIALAMIGLHRTRQGTQELPTMVYQLGGSAAGSYSMAETVSGRCATVEGGSATLVNAHGSIELRNSAAVNFESVSRNRARYRVDFSSSEGSGTNGRVAFFVHPRRKDQPFTVSTPDYRIAVTGTYFRIEADLGGKAATRVLEGSVRITDGPIGDTVLHAGQYLQFDPSIQRYRIFSGGPVVARSEVEAIPGVDTLLRYKVVSVRSKIPDADVFIDGRYFGTAPLTIRQPAGWHNAHIEKEGFETVDTLFSLTGNERVYVIAVAPEPLRRGKTTAYVHASGGYRDTPGSKPGTKKAYPKPGRTTEMLLGRLKPAVVSAQLYNDARKAERNEDWRKALKLYQQVLADPGVSPLRREDALFSVAKLQAEHVSDAEVAKEAFLTYLALFPSGTFAGESWLRLAELEFRKNPEHAIQYYLKFFEKFPRHPRIAELQNRVGVIYMQQKRYEKAISMFELALADLTAANSGLRTDIAAHLYRALLANGEGKRAESLRIRYQISAKQ